MSRDNDETAAVTAIELATIDDIPALAEIYNHSVATSHSTFDTRPSTLERWQDRFAGYAATGPHRLLVARAGATVLGYAASGRYREHEAFTATVELSVSLRAGCRGRGIGTLLYDALLAHLAGQPVHVALAGIALPNDASVALHRKFGFTEVGTFAEYAVKDGRYISSLWMQRLLGPPAGPPAR